MGFYGFCLDLFMRLIEREGRRRQREIEEEERRGGVQISL